MAWSRLYVEVALILCLQIKLIIIYYNRISDSKYVVLKVYVAGQHRHRELDINGSRKYETLPKAVNLSLWISRIARPK
jgi:hypothetical protein